MRRLFRTVMLLTLLIGSGEANDRTTKLGTIEGIVLNDSTGDPLVGAVVNIIGSTYLTTTDINGRFILARVSPGEYSLTITLSGFESARAIGVIVDSTQTSLLTVRLAQIDHHADSATSVRGKSDIIETPKNSGTVPAGRENTKSRPVQSVDRLLDNVPRLQINSSPNHMFAESVVTKLAHNLNFAKPLPLRHA